MSEEKVYTEIKERKRWLFFGLPFTFTVYKLQQKNLGLKRGFFTTIEDDLLLFRVLDVTVRRTLAQKMAGLGTITIISSDKTNPTFELKNIKRVHSFKKALDERVEDERMRMRFRTGEYVGNEFQEDVNMDDHSG